MQNNFNTNPKYKNKKNMTPPPIKTTDLSNDFDDLNVLQSDSLNCNSIAIKQSTRLSSNSNSNLSYSSVSSVNSSNLTSSSGSSVIIGEDFTVGSRISTNCSGSSPQAFNRRSREDHNQNISYNGNGARRHSNPSNVYTYNNRNNNHKERYVFSK